MCISDSYGIPQPFMFDTGRGGFLKTTLRTFYVFMKNVLSFSYSVVQATLHGSKLFQCALTRTDGKMSISSRMIGNIALLIKGYVIIDKSCRKLRETILNMQIESWISCLKLRACSTSSNYLKIRRARPWVFPIGNRPTQLNFYNPLPKQLRSKLITFILGNNKNGWKFSQVNMQLGR